VILKDGAVQELIEVKYSEENIPKSLRYYVERLRPPKATPIMAMLKRTYSSGIISVVDPLSYFSGAVYGNARLTSVIFVNFRRIRLV
jgi:hypothetical protein